MSLASDLAVVPHYYDGDMTKYCGLRSRATIWKRRNASAHTLFRSDTIITINIKSDKVKFEKTNRHYAKSDVIVTRLLTNVCTVGVLRLRSMSF